MENGGTSTLTATIGNPSYMDITVNLGYSGTATGSGTDYSGAATITITAGSLTGTTVITSVNDNFYEGANETIIVDVTGVSANATENGVQQQTVTITDGQVPAVVTLSKSATTLGENGGTATLTATLNNRTTTDTDVTITYTGTASGSDYTGSTTITVLAGSLSQAITLTGVNDAVYEGNETIIADVTGVTNGTESGTQSQTITITDDESVPTVTLSAGTATIAETGGTSTITATLNHATTVDTVVNLGYAGTATSGTDFTGGSASITIPALSTSNFITLTSSADSIDESNETIIVSISTVTGGNGATENGTQSQTVTITDDDTAGVTVSAVTGSTDEANSNTHATYTLVLNSEPTGNVVVNVVPDAQNSVDNTTVTFTTANWNTPQTITVTAVNDSIDELNSHTGSIAHTINTGSTVDTTYDAVTGIASASISVADNDTAGVTISAITGSTDEGNSATKATYTIVLNSEPTGNVVVGVATDSQNTVDKSSVTFTTANWNTPQTITVTAVNDSLDEAATHTGTITHTITTGSTADANYDVVTGIADASISVADNDTAGVTISAVTGNTSEGNSATKATYTIVLNSQPTGNVVIDIATDTQNTIDKSSVTFTTANWNTAQTITATAVNDSVDEAATHTGTITHTINTGSTADATYDAVTGIADSTINVTDNDTAGVTISAVTGSTSEANSATKATYTIVLTSQPTGDVVIDIATDAQNTIDKSSVTFTNANWNTTQTVTVTAVNDSIDEAATHTGTITHTINTGSTVDANYDAVTGIANATINVTDNDTAGVTISAVTGSTSEANSGTQATYTIVLNSQPTGNVVVNIATDAQNTVDKSSVTFTTSDWSTPQTVTATAVNDTSFESNPHNGTITHTINTSSTADTTYDAVTGIANATISVADNDAPGVTISAVTGSTDEGNSGTQATYTIVLNTLPTGNVVVNVSSDSQNTVDKSSVTFTTGDWNLPQTITVTAVNDSIDEAASHNGTISHTINTGSTADANYDAVTGISSSTVSVADNDTAGVTITQSSGSTDVTEGGTTDSYTVVLNSQPTASVTIAFTTGTQVNSITSMTFTTANWNSAQTATVTATNDSVAEGAHTQSITHAATSTDTNYSGISISAVTANITDNDTAGVTITQSGTTNVTEGGVTDSYTVVLTSQPTADVTIAFTTGTQVNSITSMTFTNANWNSAQTATVTATNDSVAEGAHTQSITHTATSSDTTYNGITISAVTANITDNDTAGVTITQSAGTTNVVEGGATDSYTVVLTSQPTADVTITFTTGTQVNSITSMTFTSANWSSAQTATVTATNDSVAEGAHTQSITHAATSTDPNYNGGSVSIASVTANITDNDTAGVTITQSAGTTNVTEGGATDDYTVVLTSQPTADVTIAFTTGTQVNSITSMTFTSANWNTPQTATVTATNDSVAEGAHTQSITHAASSTDGNYNGGAVTIASVTANITDNDTAGVTITQSAGTTNVTEGGATDDYTVVLTSQPTASVTIAFTTGSQVNGISDITFTTANWNSAQTITISPVDDNVAEGAHTQNITHAATSTDTNYSGIAISSVTANITDNDTAGVTITQSSGSTDVTEGGATDTYTVVLNTQPTASVTIAFSTGTQINAITSLTFTTSNWNSAQTVTVTATNDSIAEGAHTQSITHSASSADGNYNGGAITIASVTANITDNDIVGVTIAESGGSTNITEAGGTDTYTVVLNTQPAADVTIAFSVGTQVNAITSLTFTTANWNSAQTVTVSAVNDAVAEGAHTQSITHSATSTDGNYNGGAVTIASVTANIADNDTAGVTITESSGSTNVTEGGATDTYSVVLNTQPTADVTIAFSTGTQISSITSLTFTTVNWNTAQTVTVTAANDNSVEGAHTQSISHTATSGDGNYNGVSISSVTANITDNDVAGVTITESSGSTNISEAGTTDSYTVVLTAQPTSDVTISFSVGTQVSAITSLTFTNANWNSAQTVTVSAVDDSIFEGAHTQAITHASSSSDSNFNLLTISSVTTNITDNDSQPTVQFSAATANSTDETSSNRTVTISLSNASSQTVSVVVTDAGGTALTGTDYSNIGSPLTVNITAGTTSTNVTIAVISDVIFEGNETINLSLSSPTNATLGAQTSHVFTIIDDEIGITSAETMDCDNNGRIDHYKLTFSMAVTDSTFPGYSLNALGTTTTDWQVAGYSTVKLRHGTAVGTACSGVTDTANDAVLYINFAEGGSYDTGSKPDFTTTSTPSLTANSGANTMSQVFTANVTESDKAKPVIVSATGSSGASTLTVTFSEVVYGNSGMPACNNNATDGPDGDLKTNGFTYSDASAGGAGSISAIGSDTCASSDSNVTITMNANFNSGDNGVDTVAATANVYDASNNTGNTTAKGLSVTGGSNPSITSIEEYDTNGNGNIDQLKIVFSMAMADSTIDDADAARFTVGGTAASKVDIGTSGTGSITSPNTDTGTANDSTVTIFTDDATVTGTALKAVTFTTNSGRWRSGTGFDLLTASDLTSVTADKAPPVILTAVASPTGNTNATVDSGDTLVLTFSEVTDKSITTANINSVLTLSSSHTWGNLTSATWNSNGDVLTVTFAGTGSPTIAVGDYITIANTLKDNANNTSTSKISVNAISGSFGSDTTAPYVVYASDITTNTLIVQFSEAMRMSSGTASQNADNISNYTLVEDPANACADVTLSSITVLSTSSIQLTLGSSQTFCNIQYKVTVASTVTDLAGNVMGSPNYITFIGLERIKVVSATATSTNTIKVVFNKPPKSGAYNSGSNPYTVECSNSTDCATRFKISPTIGDGTISSVVVGSGSNNYTATITHNGTQAGSAYTVIAANATDSDGFTNGTACIKDIGLSNCIQTAPGDRATFIGAGTVCNTLACGSFFSDPFFDGTSFSYAFKYDSKVYLGTNDKNNAAFRFDSVGANAILTTFKFTNSSSVSLSCSSATGFGYITSDLSTQTCGTNGGPNGEVGAVGFNSVNLTVSSTNYELLLVGALKNNVDTIYYSQDKDTLLDMKSFTITGTNGVNSKSAQTIYGNADKVFTGISSDHGTNAPILNRVPATVSSGTVTLGSPYGMNGNLIPYLGKQGAVSNPNSSGVVGIDTIFTQGSSTYLANNGGVIYVTTSGTSGLLGVTGNLTNNDWKVGGTLGSVLSTPSGATGTSLYMPASNATTGGGLGKIRPGEKAYPYIVAIVGKLYLVRNVGDTTPTTNLRGEVWTCTPNGSGQCAPGGWSKIISGTETDLNSDNKAISMFIVNGSNIYVGFDGPTNGIKVFKYSGTAPSATSGTMSSASWTQQGTDGLGSSSKYIMTSVSVYDQITNKSYVYIVIGNGLGSGSAIKVVRQADDGQNSPVAFLNDTLFESELLAYINKGEAKYPIWLSILVIGILGFFGVRELLKRRTQIQ